MHGANHRVLHWFRGVMCQQQSFVPEDPCKGKSIMRGGAKNPVFQHCAQCGCPLKIQAQSAFYLLHKPWHSLYPHASVSLLQLCSLFHLLGTAPGSPPLAQHSGFSTLPGFTLEPDTEYFPRLHIYRGSGDPSGENISQSMSD